MKSNCEKRNISSQSYWYILLNAIGLTPGGSSTVHIYTQTISKTTQLIWESYGPKYTEYTERNIYNSKNT